MKNLVSTDWLEKNLKNVKILDGTWHMPSTDRNAYDEFFNNHIENSIFFNLDENSCQDSLLPHMLPKKKKIGKMYYLNWELKILIIL